MTHRSISSMRHIRIYQNISVTYQLTTTHEVTPISGAGPKERLVAYFGIFGAAEQHIAHHEHIDMPS